MSINETENNQSSQNIFIENEINFIDLFFILWKRRIIIICFTTIGAVLSVLLSIISLKLPQEKSFLPNKYTPQTFLLIDDKSLSGGGFSPSGDIGNMGGLAAIAGIGLAGRATYTQLALFLVKSNTMLDAIIDEFKLIEKYKIKKSPKAVSRKIIRDKLNTKADERTSGVITISFTDKDPVFARDVVNFTTLHLERLFASLGLDKSEIEKENLESNISSTFEDILRLENENKELEQSVASTSSFGRIPAITTEMNRISLELSTKRQIYAQLKVRLEMLNVSLASEKKILQILEMAEVPDMKSGPSRGKICIIVTAVSGIFSIFLVFILNAISNFKKDSIMFEKWRGKNEK